MGCGATRDGAIDDRALLRRLHAEVAATGALDRPTARSWAKFAVMVGGLAGTIALIVALPWWAAPALLPLAALFSAAIGMMGHEGSHRSACASTLGNQILAAIAFALFAGQGERFWRSKHNRSHHREPNVVGADIDLSMWPFATSSDDYRRSGRARRWFQRHLQGFLFWPTTMLLVFGMRIDTVIFLVAQARAGRLDRLLAIDTLAVVAHYVLWLVLPALVFGPWPTLLFYVTLWMLVGLLVAGFFALGHIGCPVVSGYRSNLWLQMDTTRSIRMPALLSFFGMGLDYQLEHHLFPRVSHLHLPAVARVVKAFAAREGLPYHEARFGPALADATRFMANAWRIEPVALDR